METNKLIKGLLNPLIYPDLPEKVELIQTHISWIFLSSDYVYKIKKRVNFGFLDYSTLEKRRFFCKEEIRLNKRLAPEIYLDVVEIKEDDEGKISFEEGKTVEFAVMMKKLPQDRMMNKLLKEGTITKEMIETIARKLYLFHQEARCNEEILQYGELELIRKNIDDNFLQTQPFVDLNISKERYTQISD